jgi:sugar phosphate isomerase/epimerase
MQKLQAPHFTNKTDYIRWANEQLSLGVARQEICHALLEDGLHDDEFYTRAGAGFACASVMVERNVKGRELEKAGQIDEAIKLYEQNIAFWQHEIPRWAAAGIGVVLENDTDKSPSLLLRLVNAVDHPFLGLCLDIGHQHMFSDLDALEWLRWMAPRLRHIHLHDNDRTRDAHWSIGRGTIDFEHFYAAILEQVPQATLSLEVEDSMDVRMTDLRRLAAIFASEQTSK